MLQPLGLSLFRFTAQITLLGVLALASAFAQQGHPATQRLQAVETALAGGNTAALPQFWDEVTRLGSPLIERGRPGFVLVTFPWHGSRGTRSVSLLSGPQFLGHYKNQFTQLADTDLWYLTVEMPDGLRIGYVLSETSVSAGSDGVMAQKKSSGSDPLNLRGSEYDPTLPPSRTSPYSIFETPNAPQETWLRRHAGIPPGELETHEIFSHILDANRKIQVYRPRSIRPGNQPIGCIYLFDGDAYLGDMHVTDVLDNLVGERKIGPVIAVLISSLPGKDRDRELQCDPRFTEFIGSELVPWVRAHYPVSRDPSKNIVGGYSLGALEAAFVARKHPDLFGAVLAQSPSLWWRPDGGDAAELDPWIAREYVTSAKLRTRFYISVGRDEPTIIEKSKTFERLLRTHGHDVDLEEIEGQHDPLNWRLTLPRGLMFLGQGP